MKNCFFIFIIFLQSNFLISQNFTKDQYQAELKLFLNKVKEAENLFKDIDKELNKRFSTENQKSLYYLVIIEDFNELKKLVIDLSSSSKKLENYVSNYRKSFSVGKSKKDEVSTDDEIFKKKEEQFNLINDSFNSENENLTKIKNLDELISKNFREVDEIKELTKKLEKEVISFKRDIEKSRVESKKTVDDYNNASSWLINFPIYEDGLFIRDELIDFQENIIELKIKLEENENDLRGLFSGVFKNNINDPYKYYQKLKKNQLDTILKLRNDLQEIPNKRISLQDFQNVIEVFRKDVLLSKTELEKFIRPTFRNIDQISSNVELVNKNFNNIVSDFENFPIVIIAKTINDSIAIMNTNLILTKDSLTANLKKYERFLSGKYFPKDKDNHFKTFDMIKNDVDILKNQSEAQFVEINSIIESLIDVSKLIEEFKNEIFLMDKKILSLKDNIILNKEIFNIDSIRYNSLINKMPIDFSIEVFPYLELKSSFNKMEKKIFLIESQYDSLIFFKKSFIEHVGTMKGIRNEKEKYDIFKNFVTDFKSINKLSSGELIKFEELNLNFKNNVKENFKNTVEFWSIVYKTNDSNEINFSENFGYLIDLNRFPVPQYYGQLISDYQFKLIRNNKKYIINFLTSSDLPIKGFQILSSKNEILIESIFEQWEEIELDNIKYFSSSVDVSINSLYSLIQSEDHILKILFTSMQNKINLTMYETKIYKKYKIPEKRLDIWSNQLNIK